MMEICIPGRCSALPQMCWSSQPAWALQHPSAAPVRALGDVLVDKSPNLALKSTGTQSCSHKVPVSSYSAFPLGSGSKFPPALLQTAGSASARSMGKQKHGLKSPPPKLKVFLFLFTWPRWALPGGSIISTDWKKVEKEQVLHAIFFISY